MTKNIGLSIIAWGLMLMGWGFLIFAFLFSITGIGLIIGIPLMFCGAVLIGLAILIKKSNKGE